MRGRAAATGLTVVPSWQDFARFRADMGERPDGMRLYRLDASKGYGPGNCRWDYAAGAVSTRTTYAPLLCRRPGCGVTFTPIRRDQVFHSPECRRSYYRGLQTHACPLCGAVHRPKLA